MVLKGNWPLERHASKVYTRSMFEQFGESLYKAGSFVTEEVEHRRKYIVSHVEAERRNGWCKVVFIVTVDADMTQFVCECGFFEHAGLLCPHAIKVSITSLT